jgi:hypothetical protein
MKRRGIFARQKHFIEMTGIWKQNISQLEQGGHHMVYAERRIGNQVVSHHISHIVTTAETLILTEENGSNHSNIELLITKTLISLGLSCWMIILQYVTICFLCVRNWQDMFQCAVRYTDIHGRIPAATSYVSFIVMNIFNIRQEIIFLVDTTHFASCYL